MARATGSHSPTADTQFRGNRAATPRRRPTRSAAPAPTTRPTGADPKATTGGTLKRTLKEFSEDNLTDWAAALTYYGVLALFPALIALLSIIGLLVDPKTLTDALTAVVPASAADTLKPGDRADRRQHQRRRASAWSSVSPAPSGRRRATSARSPGRRTSSTRRRKAARSGSSSRCSC